MFTKRLGIAGLVVGLVPVKLILSALVAATVVLLGFLLSGVLSDDKESEKLPGEISACMLALGHELVALRSLMPEAPTPEALEALSVAADSTMAWIRGRASTEDLHPRVHRLMLPQAALQAFNLPPLQLHFHAELADLRRAVLRVQVMRPTTSVRSV